MKVPEEIYYAYRWSFDRVKNTNRFNGNAIIDEIEWIGRPDKVGFTPLRKRFYNFFIKYINENK